MSRLENSIRQAQCGDNQAFRYLFDSYGTVVYAVCLRYMRNSEEAKDLMQEVFIKLYFRLSEFRFEGSFEGWLKKLTVNLAIDEIRKSKNWNKLQTTTERSSANDEFASEEIYSDLAVQDLLKLVNELPPVYRLIFNLYAIEGYKHHEIASMLGISEGTSKSNLHDARKLLQKRLYRIMNG